MQIIMNALQTPIHIAFLLAIACISSALLISCYRYHDGGFIYGHSNQQAYLRMKEGGARLTPEVLETWFQQDQSTTQRFTQFQRTVLYLVEKARTPSQRREYAELYLRHYRDIVDGKFEGRTETNYLWSKKSQTLDTDDYARFAYRRMGMRFMEKGRRIRPEMRWLAEEMNKVRPFAYEVAVPTEPSAVGMEFWPYQPGGGS